MNRRKLPFNALRAFEAAARHASVSAAAKELSVTHSAVSHQLKHLESELGVDLFQRTNRGLKITADAESLLPVLLESFDRISATLDGIRQRQLDEVIHVTCTPSFASKWLVPRLSEWYASENSCRIHLHPGLDFFDFKSKKVDIAIRCGIPPWKQLDHELFMPIHLVPVCSPDYLRQKGTITEPEQLLGFDLIHADVGDHGMGEEWCDWLRGCGVECPKKIDGLSFHDPALAMQAAADGLGIAIGYRELIDKDLKSGQLILASPQAIKHAFSYYLVFSSDRKSQAMETFENWLMQSID